MSNYDEIKNAFEVYQSEHGISPILNLESNLIQTSYDEINSVNVYNGTKNLNVIDLDSFAKNVYFKIYGDEENNDNTINSPDAFLVNKDKGEVR